LKSLMPPEAYIDEAWFARERELVMKPLWQFVGPKMLLGKHNAFLRRSICGVDVVVQNFHGELRAFENSCLHRQNPIQQQPQGVRPLVCNYHGWGYGAEGAVENIPFHDSAYRLPTQERACLKLRGFQLRCVGQLVFVNLSTQPLAIEQQFSTAMLDSLERVSAHFDNEVLIARFPARCNWKLAYENLRDSLHPRYVHSRTLYQQVKFAPSMDETAIADVRRYHQAGSADHEAHMARLRTFSNGGLDSPIQNMPRFSWHENVERFGTDDWYMNWLAFPNLHIASGSGGHSFIIEHHQPVSAHSTELLVYYVTARKKRSYPTSGAVLLSHLEGATKVLREDIEIMEHVQQGLAPHVPRATLGDFEYINQAVERWYMDVMERRRGIA